MLLYLSSDAEILGYNQVISNSEAENYINGQSCIWVEGLEINIPQYGEDETLKMYYVDGTISYVVEKTPVEEKPKTEIVEILEKTRAIDNTTQIVSDDNLLNMELICELDEKLNLILEHLGLTV